MTLIVANWKMNPINTLQAENLFQEIVNETKSEKNTEIVVCPPFIYLPVIKNLLSSNNIKLGSQNCFWEEKGAFTGEVSPLQLKNLEVKYIILGHSERRNYLKEDDEMIAKKIKAVLETHLSPILCIGETKEEKIADKTPETLKSQLENDLQYISSNIYNLGSFVIAYEPIWAIGTGDFCQPDEALSNLLFIKKQLLRFFPKKIAEKIRILYGGSVDSKNAKDYIEIGFDGLLVGGASLRTGEFIKIVKNIETNTANKNS
ncbi:MAG TPA: triose-phosphate isomerase [Candidatus Pacearchaeota archaeon]|nr:triose-phosphate isomerase [Candidatus Pacearchaeota archaeon]HOK94252.1 triose-phosphate isomerase [Candidatus Pacearchaeota archaeon]HPO75366.1 triose-phosphate isomerase [Candidatus Pacearchaeota archaeon]